MSLSEALARFQPHSSSFLDITDHGMLGYTTDPRRTSPGHRGQHRARHGWQADTLLDVLDVEGLPPDGTETLEG